MEGRLREKGLDGMGRGWQGGGVFAEASNQISLMKWLIVRNSKNTTALPAPSHPVQSFLPQPSFHLPALSSPLPFSGSVCSVAIVVLHIDFCIEDHVSGWAVFLDRQCFWAECLLGCRGGGGGRGTAQGERFRLLHTIIILLMKWSTT